MKASAEQKYLETSIATASKEDLIVKIFDVLIIAAQQAHEKLTNDRDDITEMADGRTLAEAAKKALAREHNA